MTLYTYSEQNVFTTSDSDIAIYSMYIISTAGETTEHDTADYAKSQYPPQSKTNHQEKYQKIC